MMNFADIRLDNYYYVDKTSFIPVIEQSDRFFFSSAAPVRQEPYAEPMLQHYYDVRTRDKFDALFGDLYIESIPHRDRNSYLVLYLNFSGISVEVEQLPSRVGCTLQYQLRLFLWYLCRIPAERH